ncbi:MAG: hypothetical protein CME64_05840 [Halobacteriovoraceae bacterium]|nr:hypothetical protein [Halobacteriovoraceae bacterium]|tara:strand:- start:175503 stop:177056 length:1554 start_codon:yes stop_codon:yes gene_type:complete
MPKLFLILALLFTFNSYSQAKQYLNPQAYFDVAEKLEGGPDGISYYQVMPEYEKNADPERQVALEFYFGEYDGSEKSKRQLEWIKELIEQDKATAPSFTMETLVTGRHAEGLEKSDEIDEMIKALNAKNIAFDEMPEYLFEEGKSRNPSSTKDMLNKVKGFALDQRNFWTFVRGASGAAGVYAGLVLTSGVSPGVAAIAALVPGLASGAITYHLGKFGRWITNGKWIDHMLRSDGIVARNLRKAFRVSPQRYAANLKKNHGKLVRSYPLMNYDSPEYVKMMADLETSKNFNKVVTRLKVFEENIKWYLTEVAFTGIAFKAPQVTLGIAAYTSAITTINDTLIGATLGFAAQGPGDIAIQLHKFKKLGALKEKIQQGEHPNPTKEIQFKGQTVSKTLLEEIDMVLSTNKDYGNYTVGKHSHKVLRGIENWSRAAATGLSFFSVAGVALEIAGVPAARPLLIGVGIGGAAYLAQVKGWINLSAPKAVTKKYQSMLNKSKDFVHGITTRYCQQKFLPRIN